jgi:hypothetical protein
MGCRCSLRVYERKGFCANHLSSQRFPRALAKIGLFPDGYRSRGDGFHGSVDHNRHFAGPCSTANEPSAYPWRITHYADFGRFERFHRCAAINGTLIWTIRRQSHEISPPTTSGRLPANSECRLSDLIKDKSNFDVSSSQCRECLLHIFHVVVH